MPRRLIGVLVLVGALAALALGVSVLRSHGSGPSTDSIERMQNDKVRITIVPSSQVGDAAARMVDCITKGRKLHWTQAHEMRCAGLKP